VSGARSSKSFRPRNSAPCPYCGKPIRFFDWRRINGVATKSCATCGTVLEYGVPPDPTELYSDSRVCGHCGETVFFDVDAD